MCLHCRRRFFLGFRFKQAIRTGRCILFLGPGVNMAFRDWRNGQEEVPGCPSAWELKRILQRALQRKPNPSPELRRVRLVSVSPASGERGFGLVTAPILATRGFGWWRFGFFFDLKLRDWRLGLGLSAVRFPFCGPQSGECGGCLRLLLA